MADDNYLPGFDAKLTFNGAEVVSARNVTLTLDRAEIDVSHRGRDGWGGTGVGLKKVSLDFELLDQVGDAGFAAVKTAWLDGGSVPVIVLDKLSGSGLTARFVVTSFARSEALEDAIAYSVTCKLADQATPPSWS